MVKFPKIILTFLLVNLFAIEAWAQISVPNYSFSGEEITEFKVKPNYTLLQFNFAMPNEMEIYLSKRKTELETGSKKDYKSEEPGAMYKNQKTASFSSIFVGPKAFRNNVVKLFLNKEYLEVVASYTMFENKLVDTEFAEETKFLYGVSLFKTGNQKEGVDVLISMFNSRTEYGKLSIDAVFKFASEIKSYPIMEKAASNVHEFTMYSLSKWIEFLYEKDRYTDIIKLLDTYPQLEKEYKTFKNVRVTCYYFLQDYAKVDEISKSIKDKKILPLVADSYIMSKQFDKAKKVLMEMKVDDTFLLLTGKIDIAEGKLERAAEKAKKITRDNEKLSLLFYSISEQFKKINISYLKSFKFKDKVNNDYVNFYLGIKYYEMRKYADASLHFSLIAFNKHLIKASYFYQGMAMINIDINRAEFSFNKYLSVGNDANQLMLAKYMLGQVYFLKKLYDDALMLVDDCTTNYCKILKADIYFALNDEEKGYALVKDLNEDRAKLIKANYYYNKKDYNKSLAEIEGIKQKDVNAEYIKMMCLFKTNKPVEAEKLLVKNISNHNVFNSGMLQLILLGQGKKALGFMDKKENLEPKLRLERAKLYVNEKEYAKAERDYNKLIIDGEYLFDSLSGLFEISKVQGNAPEFMKDKFVFIDKSIDFKNKDMFVSDIIVYANRVKEVNTAISYINYFETNYPNSPYLQTVLNMKVKLFQANKRYDSCVQEANNVIAQNDSRKEEAMFTKAECLEYIDNLESSLTYREVADTSIRFMVPALTRIIKMSLSSDDILYAAEKIKQNDPKLWQEGILRFLEISTSDDYAKYEQTITNFSNKSTSKIRAASFWRIGKELYNQKKYDEAALSFMTGYYLVPNDKKYSLENLYGAIESYSKRDMQRELVILDKLVYSTAKDLNVNVKARNFNKLPLDDKKVEAAKAINNAEVKKEVKKEEQPKAEAKDEAKEVKEEPKKENKEKKEKKDDKSDKKEVKKEKDSKEKKKEDKK